MKYSKSVIGLLNAQYRSVLQKCLLINLGIFALTLPVKAEEIVFPYPTLDRLNAEDPDTYIRKSAYSLLDEGETSNTGMVITAYSIDDEDGKIVSEMEKQLDILQTTYRDRTGEQNISYAWNDNTGRLNVTISGASIRPTQNSDGTFDGDFVGNSKFDYKGGGLYNRTNLDNIETKFIGNAITGYKSSGGAIFNAANVGSLTGNFIGNTADLAGGAVANDEKITTITGDFIGNIATNAKSLGGALRNQGTITNVYGDFIANTANRGGAIDND